MRILTMALLLIGAGTGYTAEDIDKLAASCATCHTGPLDLAERDQEPLVAAIRDVRDGRKAHPPQPMGELDDTALAALAARLRERSK